MRAREVAGPDRPVEGMARAGDRGTDKRGNVGVVTAPTSGRRGMGAVLVFMPTRSHHLVLGDDDRSREASLAMKESTRQVKTVSA
jgi:hypothetical protein